ncbi:sensor histidine kinase [Pyxidicoccus caerfyrddinensis]|uniref:sensor histidine kinase n=1 Tax=Pyxidicoccus caerfyrddinensis TaxID=2709663 RepID=UPI0013D933B3|nr:HAMP domain-containing sensor histidine kinase [Pyxidicoccus caerfyrddinensis]
MARDADFSEQDRERLRLALEATGLGTWEYDARTGALTWDAQARALFGLPPGTPMGLEDFLKRVHPEDRVRTQAVIRQALQPEGAGRYSAEYRVHTTRGVRWVAAHGRTLFDGEGRPRRLLGTLEDITEQKRAELFRDRLPGIVGHDLRDPLTHISLATQQLLRREGMTEPMLMGVRRIATCADRMARRVHDLLDFTRASVGGGIPLERRPTDLCVLVRDTVAGFELTHPGRVQLACARGAQTGSWDADRLAQVVSNLVDNALVHGDEESPVHVTVVADGPDVVLAVHNDGPPVPATLLPRIFDPFEQVAGDGGRQGPGLGRYIAQQLVLAHGGDLTVRSSAAEGTVFTVRLPRMLSDETALSSLPG